MWNRKCLSMEPKLIVYRAVVLPSLLYASETWITYSQHLTKLNCVYLLYLHSIMGIKWQENVMNIDVPQCVNMPSICTMMRTNQLRRSGHLVKMNDNRLPKRIFYSQLV